MNSNGGQLEDGNSLPSPRFVRRQLTIWLSGIVSHLYNVA